MTAHRRAYKSRLSLLILNQINPVHAPNRFFSSILILFSHPRLDLPKSLLLSSLSNKTLYAHFSPTCYNLTYATLKALLLIIHNLRTIYWHWCCSNLSQTLSIYINISWDLHKNYELTRGLHWHSLRNCLRGENLSLYRIWKEKTTTYIVSHIFSWRAESKVRRIDKTLGV
jgi:hypothetical protein